MQKKRKYIKVIAAITAVCVLCAGCGGYTTLPLQRELPVKTTRKASTADDVAVATSLTRVATQTTAIATTTTELTTTATTETTTTEAATVTSEMVQTTQMTEQEVQSPEPYVPEENLVINDPAQEEAEPVQVIPVLEGEVTVQNIQVSTISVSCLKLTWNADAGRTGLPGL